MILHFFPDEKFTLDYLQRVDSLFGFSNHFFWIHRCQPGIEERYAAYCDHHNCLFKSIDYSCFPLLEKKLREADVVIFHSLPVSTETMSFIYDQTKDTSKRLVWVLWGGDLYNAYDSVHSYRILRHTFKKLRKESIRKKLIKRMDYVVSGCDYEELKKRYRTDAVELRGVYSFQVVEVTEPEPHELVNVMVGHSATSTCKHIETFQSLLPYKDKIHVFCPLSYPEESKRYIRKVIKHGEKCFGDAFVPITDFVPYEQYVRFLNNMDVGVFNNSRQQGNGNIINLLLLGKKVYLSKENTLRNIYDKRHYAIFDYETMDMSMLEPLSSEEKARNHELILTELSDQTFYERWNVIFSV